MSDTAANSPEEIPSRLGDFQIVREIGRGGMGMVYEAVQLKLERRVALKVLSEALAKDGEFLQRFTREARSAGAINHPNLVQVYDIGEDAGRHFFAMEYVDGENLGQLLARDGKLAVEDGLRVAEEVVRALKEAWEQGIIHRDVKPENIMVTRRGLVKLADLGLAKQVGGDFDLTLTGAGLGSPYYMAPEQAEDAGKVDHRADIYSLGITLLTLLTGKRPFTGSSPFSVVLAHAKTPLPSGVDLGTELPAGVEQLIQRMAAKEPAERYQEYDSLLGDLQALQADAGRVLERPAMVFSAQPKPVVPVPGPHEAETIPSAQYGSEFNTHFTHPSGAGAPTPTPASAVARSGGNRAAILAIVAATLVLLVYFALDYAKHRALAEQQAMPTNGVPVAAAPAPNPAAPAVDQEAMNFFLQRGPPGTVGLGPPGLPPPPITANLLRPGAEGPRHYPVPMGPIQRPNDTPMTDAPFVTLQQQAAAFAAANPADYWGILERYEQVWRKGQTAAERDAASAELERWVTRMDAAADKEIAGRAARMRQLVVQKRYAEALEAWQNYPPTLRSWKNDYRIWELISEAIPAAELSQISRQFPAGPGPGNNFGPPRPGMSGPPGGGTGQRKGPPGKRPPQ